MDGDGTYACSAGDVGKGDCVMLNDKPCRIVETSVSKTGKHGHAKKKFTGIHVFMIDSQIVSVPVGVVFDENDTPAFSKGSAARRR